MNEDGDNGGLLGGNLKSDGLNVCGITCRGAADIMGSSWKRSCSSEESEEEEEEEEER